MRKLERRHLCITPKEVLYAFLQYVAEMKVDLRKLIPVTTDGASAMVESNKGFDNLLHINMRDNGIDHDRLKFH